MSGLILAIDQGTTSTRAIAFEGAVEVVPWSMARISPLMRSTLAMIAGLR